MILEILEEPKQNHDNVWSGQLQHGMKWNKTPFAMLGEHSILPLDWNVDIVNFIK